ncbi:MAG: BON domain-containing protein, partial [Rhizobacter sp.]|nr:BON domain-containing protein [Rhizobacter sp.]
MGLISFLRDAGEKLFHPSGLAAAAAPAPAAAPDVAALNATASQAIERYIASQGLTADGLEVRYDGATQTVTVSGVAPDQTTEEKIVLCCGNVSSVAKVDDLLTVASGGQPESKYHDVTPGDTLSRRS